MRPASHSTGLLNTLCYQALGSAERSARWDTGKGTGQRPPTIPRDRHSLSESSASIQHDGESDWLGLSQGFTEEAAFGLSL